MRVRVAIFSYNRGEFLLNCVDSVQREWPGVEVAVFDDGSRDPETVAVLERLRARVRVVQPAADQAGRHGGLYANMQRALEEAGDDEVVLMLQDDVQVVRPVGADDGAQIEAFFARYPRAAFLWPCFLKGARARRDRRITRVAPEFPVYFRDYPEKKNARGLSYADVVLVHVGRLRAAGWRFEGGEVANAARAHRLFGPMGFMAHPFVMYLPQVPVYRQKRKTWGVALAERRAGTAPKRFVPMTAAETAALKQRDLAVLPVAEAFLRCEDPRVRRPFRYGAVNAFPLFHLLHKVEQGWRRWRGR